MLRVNSVTI